MNKLLIANLLTIVNVSCRYEDSTYTETYIVNNTMHKISIYPFNQGIVHSYGMKDIPADSIIIILSHESRGKSEGFSYPVYPL